MTHGTYSFIDKFGNVRLVEMCADGYPDYAICLLRTWLYQQKPPSNLAADEAARDFAHWARNWREYEWINEWLTAEEIEARVAGGEDEELFQQGDEPWIYQPQQYMVVPVDNTWAFGGIVQDEYYEAEYYDGCQELMQTINQPITSKDQRLDCDFDWDRLPAIEIDQSASMLEKNILNSLRNGNKSSVLVEIIQRSRLIKDPIFDGPQVGAIALVNRADVRDGKVYSFQMGNLVSASSLPILDASLGDMWIEWEIDDPKNPIAKYSPLVRQWFE